MWQVLQQQTVSCCTCLLTNGVLFQPVPGRLTSGMVPASALPPSGPEEEASGTSYSRARQPVEM